MLHYRFVKIDRIFNYNELAEFGSQTSLSAINLENQEFTKQVHENVHENALKHQFWGVLLSPNKKPGTHHRVRASSSTLNQSTKHLLYPIDNRHSFEIQYPCKQNEGQIEDVSPPVRVGGWCYLLGLLHFFFL